MRELTGTFSVGETEIFERQWVTDDPEYVLVITHGANEHSEYWTDVAQAMSELGATSLGVDFPGHGRSGRGKAMISIDGCVEVIDHVIDRAKERFPTLPIVLFGHSMGGLASAKFAQSSRGRIDALVLHAPPLVERPAGQAFDPSIEEPPPGPALQERIAADPFRYTGTPSPERMAKALAELDRHADMVRDAGALADLPLVWMHGARDASIPFAGAHRAFAELASDRAVFLGYPDRGHAGLLASHSERMIRDLDSAIRFALGR